MLRLEQWGTGFFLLETPFLEVHPIFRDTPQNYIGDMGFLICKREISFVKNIPPSLDGISFTCNHNRIFNGNNYLNGNSSKYFVPAKQDKFAHIICLLEINIYY